MPEMAAWAVVALRVKITGALLNASFNMRRRASRVASDVALSDSGAPVG